MTYPGQPVAEQAAFDPHEFLRDFEARLDAVQHDALNVPAGTVVSVVLSTPELISADGQTVRQGDFYWSRPAKQELRISTGVTWTLCAEGQHRLAHLDRALHGIAHQWKTCNPDGITPASAAWTGFAFDPTDTMQGEWAGLPNAMLQIPELALVRHGAECQLALSTRINQNTKPESVHRSWLEHVKRLLARFNAEKLQTRRSSGTSRIELVYYGHQKDLWAERVTQALQDIEENRVEKLVLTRRMRVHTSREIQLTRVLGYLETMYPDCIQFCVPVGNRSLVGASPERLVCVDHGSAVVDAVASTEPHDRRQTDNPELFENRKARHEHQLVVNAISNALGPISSEIIVPEHPHLMTLPNVHHLWSPVRARLLPGTTLLAAADKLHPTPAIGGTPRHAAGRWLRAHGEQNRGWYTGGFGWLTPDGQGELAVILRCGLLDRRDTLLFAGAGIVAESEVAQEYQETEWKLQAMLDAIACA